MLKQLRVRLMGSLPVGLAVPLYAWRNWYSGEAELRWLRFVCAADKGAVDVGANVGIYSYWLCRLAASCNAFEANPDLAKRLKSYAGGRNLHVWPLALSDTVGKATLHIPVDPTTGLGRFGSASLVDHQDGSVFMEVEVEQARLDDLDLPPIGFLKIDVEGFELNVLHGASARIEADRPNVLIEAEDRHRANATRDVFAWFESKEYRGFFLHQGKWQSVATFEVKKHQNVENLSRRKNVATPYINNFLFLNERTLNAFKRQGFIAIDP